MPKVSGNHADTTPITEEFLLEIGFEKWQSNPCVFEIPYLKTKEKMLLWRVSESVYSVNLFGVSLKFTVKTKGDVTRILSTVGF